MQQKQGLQAQGALEAQYRWNWSSVMIVPLTIRSALAPPFHVLALSQPSAYEASSCRHPADRLRFFASWLPPSC